MADQSSSRTALFPAPQEETAYLSAKCSVVAAPAKGGHAVVAKESIAKEELIAMWSGRIVTGDGLDTVDEALRHRIVQVEEDLYLVSLSPMEGADLINHSCMPNAGLRGQIALVAMREIAPGEEITIDYAMCDGTPYDEFACFCNATSCRGKVTGEDWKRPELQRRYAGYFSPYLQRRIEHLKDDPY
ncbi:MAG: SET domain-containing protein [Methyloligella sp. ZOD6]